MASAALLVTFLVSLGVAGVALTTRLCALNAGSASAGGPRASDGIGPLEGVSAWFVVTLFVWTALNWVLAPFHAIKAPLLVGIALVGAVASVPTVARATGRAGPIARGARALGQGVGMGLVPWTLVLLPLTLWLVFAVARGSITPILSHDALSYHLPRAIDVARTGTWRYLAVEDYRLAWFPSSYEMLLADVIAITGRDQATSLVGIVSYLAGVAMAGAMGERRWGGGAVAWLTALVWAGTPLALLHSVGHKNDVLVCVEMTGVALWGARWAARGDVFSLALATVCASLAIGTKVTGLAVVPVAAVVLGPFGLWSRARAALSSPRGLVTWLLASLLAFMLAGWAPYVAHLLHRHEPLILQPDDPASFPINLAPKYGAWSNIPRFFALIFMEPFGSRDDAIWVPWRHEYWFWPRYELYFSSYGRLVSVCAAIVPVTLVLGLVSRLRGRGARGPRRREAYAATAMLLAFAFVILPTRYHTDGFFNGSARYLLFLPILAVEWGPARWVASLVRRGKVGAVVAGATLLLASASFAHTAYLNAVNDNFAPLSYLQWLMANPGYHDPSFPPTHAANIVDEQAGPNDRVLVDEGFAAWIRPAFGPRLSRPLEYLSPYEGARAAQIDRADWVMIDHFWGVAWGAPEITDMGTARRYIECGQADPRELRFADAMLADPRFEVVFNSTLRHEIVLRRRGRGLGDGK